MGRLPKFNIPGQAHFVTSRTYLKRQIFKDEKCCDILLEDINFYRNKLGYKLLGYVIMPDHFHLLVWWVIGLYPNLTISKIIQAIKGHSARQIVDYLYNPGRRGPLTSPKQSLGQGTQATQGRYPHQRMSEANFRIWQPSFYDFNVYSHWKLVQKLNYIHQNSVKAGLVKEPTDYTYSSARNYYSDDNSIIWIDAI